MLGLLAKEGLPRDKPGHVLSCIRRMWVIWAEHRRLQAEIIQSRMTINTAMVSRSDEAIELVRKQADAISNLLLPWEQENKAVTDADALKKWEAAYGKMDSAEVQRKIAERLRRDAAAIQGAGKAPNPPKMKTKKRPVKPKGKTRRTK